MVWPWKGSCQVGSWEWIGVDSVTDGLITQEGCAQGVQR